MTNHGAGERKLPKQQLAILEPLASTSLSPYLPEMIRSFGVAQKDVGSWQGICAGTFSLSQATMGIAWGRASDRYGRKPAILLGLTITLITSLVWGFSTNLPMAILARAVAGAGNGNVGIIRTTVAEMVPYKELQPLAFSIMPVVWNIGSIFGPSIGGILANPLNVKPGERTSSGSLLERYPYALPNIVSAAFFFVGITVGLLFLKETLETKRDRRDWGLVLGDKLKAAVRALYGSIRRLFYVEEASSEEHERLIRPDEEDQPKIQKKAIPPPPWKDVLTKQTILNLALYAGLAMHNMAFDQILPAYLSDERPDPSTPRHNFFNFAGGFGLNHVSIGMLNTGYAVFGMLLQFLVFPRVARRFGALYCMRGAALAFPVLYILMPFTLLFPTQKTQVAACFVLMLLKEAGAVFAFPSSTILLTNTASSLRILGTINGVATSVSAIGRAAGPALMGAMYSQGAKTGYLITSWWFLAAVALLAAIPVFFAVEGEGFGNAVEADVEDHSAVLDEEAIAVTGIEAEADVTGAGPTPKQVSKAR